MTDTWRTLPEGAAAGLRGTETRDQASDAPSDGGKLRNDLRAEADRLRAMQRNGDWPTYIRTRERMLIAEQAIERVRALCDEADRLGEERGDWGTDVAVSALRAAIGGSES